MIFTKNVVSSYFEIKTQPRKSPKAKMPWWRNILVIQIPLDFLYSVGVFENFVAQNVPEFFLETQLFLI